MAAPVMGMGGGPETKETIPTRARLHRAALEYAKRGLPVFPVKPGSKEPLTTRGHLDATTDPRRISMWWHRWPNANIGMPTGQRSGIVALDHDTYKAEARSLKEIEDQYGPVSKTRTLRTGQGGRQYHFRCPAGAEIRNSTGELAPCLDVRGKGGYVLAPPSRTTGSYEALNELPLAELPPALLKRLRKPPDPVSGRRRPHTFGPATLEDGPPILEGQRDDALTSLAGRLHDGSRPLEHLTDDLKAINEARCKPPLPTAQVAKIARSVHAMQPCPKPRPPKAVLDFVRRHRSQVLNARPWTGRGGPTDHDGYETLLDLAEQHGRPSKSGGVRVRVSVRDYALRAGIGSLQTACRSLSRMQRNRLLYRNPRITGGEAGEIVLRDVTATQGCNNQSTGLVAALSDTGLRTLLRRVRHGAGRMGKLAELALRAMLDAGGEASTHEVAERLGRRGCDVRRVLRKLAARQMVDCCGEDRFRVVSELQAEYRRVLEEDGVPESERLQRARDARAREAYRNRRNVKPDPVPEKPPAGEIRELVRVPDDEIPAGPAQTPTLEGEDMTVFRRLVTEGMAVEVAHAAILKRDWPPEPSPAEERRRVGRGGSHLCIHGKSWTFCVYCPRDRTPKARAEVAV